MVGELLVDLKAQVAKRDQRLNRRALWAGAIGQNGKRVEDHEVLHGFVFSWRKIEIDIDKS